ncbi:MAG: ketopantoate reductase family protein [Acidimicrobiia bacterium]
MTYVIYGAGAIGATIGGQLAAAGLPVSLIARGDHARAMAASGLELRTPAGVATHRLPVFEHPGEAGLRSEDVVLLCTKSQDSAAVLDALAATGFDGAVVCAQNGVDNERQALRRFEAVYGMCVQLPGTFLEPGKVSCHGAPALGCLDVGRYPHGTDATSDALAAALRAGGFQSESIPDLMASKHAKLLGNLGNALDAAVGRGAMGSELAKAARREGRACFEAAGIACRDQAAYAERVKDVGIVALDGVPARGSSSWQSLVKGSGSIEADFLNGEIVLLGRLHGVPTPVNAVLQRVANEAARTRRPPHSYRLEDIEALVTAERERTGSPATPSRR